MAKKYAKFGMHSKFYLEKFSKDERIIIKNISNSKWGLSPFFPFLVNLKISIDEY